MKVRCQQCSRFFDQHVAAQKDCPRCEREPVRQATPAVVDATMRTCITPGCGAAFRLESKRGRPPLKCPRHRKRAA